MKIGNVELQESYGVKAALCLVGPQQAAEMLKRNTRNRKLSQHVVDKYALEINMGEWLPSASGIGFGESGCLLDGQHRLAAIVASGRPVQLLVVAGLPEGCQEKLDRQRKRTLLDVFTLSGVCNDRQIVQTATFLASLGRAGSAADCEVKAAIETHWDALVAVCGACKKHTKGVAQVGVRAALVLAYEVHGEKAVQFFERLQSDLHTRFDDPAFRLRKVLLGETNSSALVAKNGGGTQYWSFRKTLFAFNAYIENRPISKVMDSDEVVPAAP